MAEVSRKDDGSSEAAVRTPVHEGNEFLERGRVVPVGEQLRETVRRDQPVNELERRRETEPGHLLRGSRAQRLQHYSIDARATTRARKRERPSVLLLRLPFRGRSAVPGAAHESSRWSATRRHMSRRAMASPR
jgi:hypothetical protein